MPPRNVASVLDDVIAAAQFISVRRDRLSTAAFLTDEEAQTMFERKFEVIGEALGLLRRQSPEVFARIRHARGAVDFRNVIIHGYAVIDHEAVWAIATRMLPELLLDAKAERTRIG